MNLSHIYIEFVGLCVGLLETNIFQATNGKLKHELVIQCPFCKSAVLKVNHHGLNILR